MASFEDYPLRARHHVAFLILTKVLGKKYNDSHFAYEETEAQRASRLGSCLTPELSTGPY